MTLFPDGACTESQRELMCKGIYLATMDCHQRGVGDVSGMHPMCITELNTSGTPNFTPRYYERRSRGDRPDMGFGFAFAPKSNSHVHKARVMVLDYSKWTLRHYIHFLCKYLYFVVTSTIFYFLARFSTRAPWFAGQRIEFFVLSPGFESHLDHSNFEPQSQFKDDQNFLCGRKKRFPKWGILPMSSLSVLFAKIYC